jgi:hypothetical protein
MSEAEATITPLPPPERPRFQFTLRTLLLVIVVLASSLAVFGAWGIVMFGLSAALAFDQYRSQRPSFTVAASFGLLGFIAFFAWAFSVLSNVKEVARCAGCSNKMQQIAHALKQYEQANGAYPPAYIADTSGKPIHSWRMLVSPCLGYDGALKNYDLAEPWNGPKNSILTSAPLTGFACTSERSSPTLTNYVAVVGKNAAWLGDKPRKLADFGSKAADTILVIEVVNSDIKWAEPRDLSLDNLTAKGATLAPQLGSNHGPKSDFFSVNDGANGAYAIMADGSIRYLRASSLTPERLPALLQIGGCKEGKIAPGAELYKYGWHSNWPNIAALTVWVVSVAVLLIWAVRSGPKRRITNAT